MKKGALQLSAGFLVMMIIAIVAFGVGVTFLYKLSSSMEEKAGQLTEQTEKQIDEKLMGTNKKIAFAKMNAKIRRGDKDILGFGIKNTDPEVTEFKIEVECMMANDPETDTEICNEEVDPGSCDDFNNWIVLDDARTIKVPQREMETESLFINVPGDAPYGEYAYSLTVKKIDDDGDDIGTYDVPQRFYVIVQ